ncbi:MULTISPECIES: FecR family protein [Butyricimonas]|uniref:FecR family protein n=1 Tax=Butyricimonas TaxID=574697 RepID=UPI001D080C72|nr:MULTISPECIES: FecR domain-containing protein [Butyricimonas]MCB6974743.1 DUF4974 domain-containing protein [Butyricimonas synergistica]MCG4521485.1 DUF4974 domain-containing protein [Butyricimonas sp. DFI.6.44]
MKREIEKRIDLARQFAKRLADEKVGQGEVRVPEKKLPLRKLYDDIEVNLPRVCWESTGQEEWEIFQKRYLSKERGRRLVLGYSAVAACAVALLAVALWLYFPTQKQVKPLMIVPVASNLPTISVSDKEYVLDSAGIDRLQQQNEIAVIQKGKELTYATDLVAVEEPVWHTIRVPRQAEFSLVLGDGSHVRMNTNTVLRYRVPFTGATREVWIEGEAYFEVAPDRTRPFVVHFADNSVTVLGTQFNISCYNEQPSRTTLVSGSVCLSNSIDSVVLLPGQEGVIGADRQGINVQEADVDVNTAWLNDRFYFKERSLFEIMRALSDWYDVTVRFNDRDLGSMLFSMETKRYEDIDSVLEILENTKKICFVKKDDVIEVRRNE